MRRRSSVALLLPWVLAGCAGVSPRPDQVRAADLPTRNLGPGEAERLQQLLDAGVQYVVTRRFDEAEREARAALRIDPRAARAHAVLGMVLLQQAKLSDPPDLHQANAGDCATVLAEQLAPADPFVGWIRALFLSESGHVTAAAAAAEAALDRTQAAPAVERAALQGLAGTCRYELGEERAALPLLQAYVEVRPEDATACFRLGSCLLRIAAVPKGPKGPGNAQRDAEAAARWFARCWTLAPGDDDAALAVGTALLRASELAQARGEAGVAKERRTQALAQFRGVAEAFPGAAEPWFRIGVLAELEADAAAAVVAYGEALQRAPEHVGSLLNLAALLDAEAGNPRVVELLQTVLAVDGRTPCLTAAERARVRTRVGA